MDRIDLTATAWARVRFQTSPLGMLTALLRLTASGERHPTLGRVGARLAATIRSVPAPLLRELVPPGGQGVIPLLVRPPLAGLRDVHDELGLLESRTDLDCRDQLEVSGRRLPLARRLLDTGRLSQQLVDEVNRLWRVALAPSWASLERRLRTETLARGGQVATEGLGATLASLDPRIRWAGSALLVDRGREQRTLLDETGLVLVPSVFDTVPRLAVDGPAPCISYPIAAEPVAPQDDLVQLLGRTRSRVLAELDQPRTTQELAGRLGVPTSTVSDHLGVLHRSGLISRRRHGRLVRYERLPGSVS